MEGLIFIYVFVNKVTGYAKKWEADKIEVFLV